MTRIAVPIFRKRVSPVLDSCRRLLIIEVEGSREVERHEVYLNAFSLPERLYWMKKAKINVIICCAVTDVLDKMIQSAGIALVCGIIGDVDQVIEAFFSNGLDAPRFQMPGMHRKAAPP
jgi:predicted Fe-Mo cluster-binding NifX family protein